MQTYTVDKTKRLIDLNGDSINFQITFRVASKNKEPFDVVVVDQTTLDNSPELDYKRADKGEITGNIVQDKNVYQNFFLVLKSETPCECDVEIIKKDLPKTKMELPTLKTAPDSKANKDGNSWFSLKSILILAIVAGVGYLIYSYYMKSKAKPSEEIVTVTKPTLDKSDLPNFRFYTPKGTPRGSPSKGKPIQRNEVQKQQIENPLLHRLKKLNL